MVLKSVCNKACQGKIDAVQQQQLTPVRFAALLFVFVLPQYMLLFSGSYSPISDYPKIGKLVFANALKLFLQLLLYEHCVLASVVRSSHPYIHFLGRDAFVHEKGGGAPAAIRLLIIL